MNNNKSNRMYEHMKNTLKDIDTELKKEDIDDKTKLFDISLLLDLLKSVECGEVVLESR